ncbi:hypothetical protein WIN67_17835 [Pseudomonas idahonensis]|uniref:hypothetical protein n=1 Tax=Pseudomonas idahonensis TaxID=2942628 RepID=UPI0030D0177C
MLQGPVIRGEQMLFDATGRKLEAHTDEDRPALQSAAGNWPTSLTQQPWSDASRRTGRITLLGQPLEPSFGEVSLITFGSLKPLYDF